MNISWLPPDHPNDCMLPFAPWHLRRIQHQRDMMLDYLQLSQCLAIVLGMWWASWGIGFPWFSRSGWTVLRPCACAWLQRVEENQLNSKVWEGRWISLDVFLGRRCVARGLPWWSWCFRMLSECLRCFSPFYIDWIWESHSRAPSGHHPWGFTKLHRITILTWRAEKENFQIMLLEILLYAHVCPSSAWHLRWLQRKMNVMMGRLNQLWKCLAMISEACWKNVKEHERTWKIMKDLHMKWFSV